MIGKQMKRVGIEDMRRIARVALEKKYQYGGTGLIRELVRVGDNHFLYIKEGDYVDAHCVAVEEASGIVNNLLVLGATITGIEVKGGGME